jgi:quinol monooxygenase YgiN
MLIRIVKLTFKLDNIDQFEQIFKETKQGIKAFDGCISLELLQDKTNPNIYFTYSRWVSEVHLNRYRNSEFFNNVWGKTKELFHAKAEAWSVQEKEVAD